MPLFRIHALSLSAHALSQPAVSSWEPGEFSSEMPLLIRTVRQQDLSSLAEILASSFHAQTGIWGWLYPLLRAGIYEDLRSRLLANTPHQACLVAVKRSPSPSPKGQEWPVGTIELSLRQRHPWNFSSARCLYLSNLAVQAEYRRQGVAQQLLYRCERIALDWGFQDLHLHVLENNYQARRLYLKAGYQILHAETGMSTLLFGRPRQLLLRKRLSGN